MRVPKVNDRVSEYILLEPVGAGRFGQVFRARHHMWPDQIVAVKIPTDEAYIRVLRSEGYTTHQVRHPNIVRPLGCDPQADPPYLVMEYIGGGSLRDLMLKGRLPIERVVEILTQVLIGLSSAHAAGVVHLDIKPSNILLAEDGQVKLSDFGLGRALVSEDHVDDSLSIAQDNRAITGTLEYMAPEQRRGQPVDQRTDIYAVGVLLFEMLTGERPSGGERPSSLRDDVPQWLDDIFVRSYARLEWRFPSADAMLEAVRAQGVLSAVPIVLPVAGQVAELIEELPAAAVAAVPVSPATPVGAVAGQPAGQVRCLSCGELAWPRDSFCIHCGRALAGVRRCPRCGAFPRVQDRYCVICGGTI